MQRGLLWFLSHGNVSIYMCTALIWTVIFYLRLCICWIDEWRYHVRSDLCWSQSSGFSEMVKGFQLFFRHQNDCIKLSSSVDISYAFFLASQIYLTVKQINWCAHLMFFSLRCYLRRLWLNFNKHGWRTKSCKGACWLKCQVRYDYNLKE